MLATLILLCLGVSGAAAWIALRAPRVPALLLVAVAGIAPLAAFAFMQTSAHPSRSAYVFDVLGQFHPLSRTVVIGHDSLADLVLPDRKSTRLNSSHGYISYAVFCLKKKKEH